MSNLAGGPCRGKTVQPGKTLHDVWLGLLVRHRDGGQHVCPKGTPIYLSILLYVYLPQHLCKIFCMNIHIKQSKYTYLSSHRDGSNMSSKAKFIPFYFSICLFTNYLSITVIMWKKHFPYIYLSIYISIHHSIYPIHLSTYLGVSVYHPPVPRSMQRMVTVPRGSGMSAQMNNRKGEISGRQRFWYIDRSIDIDR